MAGVAVEDPVPESWREIARAAGCPEPALGWIEDPGPAPDPERDRHAAAGVERALTESAIALSRFYPVGPAPR
jgi:hypothetical protein